MNSDDDSSALRFRLPVVGEPAPWFRVRSSLNQRFTFESVAGRYVVLCFFMSSTYEDSQGVIDSFVVRHRQAFDDTNNCFFGVSIDPEDERRTSISQQIPGIRYFWDFDRNVSRLYGCDNGQRYVRMSVVLDERLRVYAVVPFGSDAQAHADQVMHIVATSPRAGPAVSDLVPAPVLVLPRVFEPELCRRLIEYYNEGGATESGFMREVGGKTVGVHDHGHKRRADKELQADSELRAACMARIHARLVPEIRKVFQFNATRIERHIVACYDAELGGHFRAHRDNTTPGTAHRRFAASVVLNTGEFEGGVLKFPEFGQHTYNPPLGGAVVFSCSLLHEATPVTRGLRYCYLPFLYDDAAALVREQNLHSLEPSPDGPTTEQ